MNQEAIGQVINPGEFRMPEWLLKKSELSAGAKLTFSVLAVCAGGRDFAWPSQEFLAEKVSVSVRTLQRYLDELVRCRLIEKAKKWVQGQTRNIYRFLVVMRSAVGLLKPDPQDVVVNVWPRRPETYNILISDRHAKLSPRSLPVEKILPTETPDCRDRHAKLSPPLNKEETIEEYIPPTPQEPRSSAQGGSAPGLAGGAGVFPLESKPEDPEWAAAKSRLKGRLSEDSFQGGIAPLVFEKGDSGVILRCPNPIFRSWVKKAFGQDLDEVLAEIGLAVWKLDLFTEEQQNAYERLQEKKNLENARAAPAAVAVADDAEVLEALPVEEQYGRLYRAFPRKEKFERGLAVFCRLARRKGLPKIADLMGAIRRGLSGNPSWHREGGRFVPQIHNWLMDKRWLD